MRIRRRLDARRVRNLSSRVMTPPQQSSQRSVSAPCRATSIVSRLRSASGTALAPNDVSIRHMQRVLRIYAALAKSPASPSGTGWGGMGRSVVEKPQGRALSKKDGSGSWQASRAQWPHGPRGQLAGTHASSVDAKQWKPAPATQRHVIRRRRKRCERRRRPRNYQWHRRHRQSTGGSGVGEQHIRLVNKSGALRPSIIPRLLSAALVELLRAVCVCMCARAKISGAAASQ